MSKSFFEKKQELIDLGCDISFPQYQRGCVRLPDGEFIHDDDTEVIHKAYARFYEKKNQALLEELYTLCEDVFEGCEMYLEDGDYPRKNRSDDQFHDISYGDTRRIVKALVAIRENKNPSK